MLFFKFADIFFVNSADLLKFAFTFPPAFSALIPAAAVLSKAPPKSKNFEYSSPPTFLCIPSIPLSNFPVSPFISDLNLASFSS